MMSLCYFLAKAKPSPTNPPIAKTTPPAIAIPISPSVIVTKIPLMSTNAYTTSDMTVWHLKQIKETEMK